MAGRGAAAAADDARPAVAGEAGVDRHLLGRAVILDLVVDEVRHAAIALGDDDVAGAEHAGHAGERGHQLGRADAAVGAVGERARLQLLAAEDGDLGRRHAHHGAAVGVEGEGADDGQAGAAGALRRRPSSSSFDDMVSIQMTSAPPLARAWACSAKAAAPSAMVRGPSGSNSSPVGPMSPATTISRPLAGAFVVGDAAGDARRPVRSARRRGSRPCAASGDSASRRSCW